MVVSGHQVVKSFCKCQTLYLWGAFCINFQHVENIVLAIYLSICYAVNRIEHFKKTVEMDRSIYQFLGADSMEKGHVKSLRQRFVWMIIIFMLPILLVLAYFLFITPKEAVIVNEVGEPLTVGECWEQDELFSLTVTDISKIDWNSAGLDKYLAEKNAKDVYQTQREAGSQIVNDVLEGGVLISLFHKQLRGDRQDLFHRLLRVLVSGPSFSLNK